MCLPVCSGTSLNKLAGRNPGSKVLLYVEDHTHVIIANSSIPLLDLSADRSGHPGKPGHRPFILQIVVFIIDPPRAAVDTENIHTGIRIEHAECLVQCLRMHDAWTTCTDLHL